MTTEVASRVLSAADPQNVCKALETTTALEILEHPQSQHFMKISCIKRSTEFSRFMQWSLSHPDWTPYRSEWSVFHEDYKIAGQIDSIWLDTVTGQLIMVDWKRCGELLSGDTCVQMKQVYNEAKGLHKHPKSNIPGPCSHLYDVPFNHYLAQQNLYALFLRDQYDIVLESMYLVQLHPDVGDTYNEVMLPIDYEFAQRLLDARRSGWT